tara:strand:- start:1258 stop:1848 length:591 start_codon:yes stop_codon:yes gene_type:complete
MTAKIKLNAASGGGSVSLQAPSSSSNNRVFTIPDVADAAMATVNGISEFDQWYLTASKTDNSDVTANLLRNNQAGAASQIGSGMSESSGIFSFPTTGKYLVICNAEFSINGSDNCICYTAVTTNNSSYTNHARASDGNNGTGTRVGKGTSFSFIDVTDTSQVKVKFTTGSIGSGSQLTGSTDDIPTNFIFIRLGDT